MSSRQSLKALASAERYALLFLSRGVLMRLKSPAASHGVESGGLMLRSSRRKSGFEAWSAGA